MFKTVYPSTIVYLWLTNTTRMTHLEEQFDGLYVGNDHEVMEGEMDGSVTYMGVKRKMRNRGTAPLLLNLSTKCN